MRRFKQMRDLFGEMLAIISFRIKAPLKDLLIDFWSIASPSHAGTIGRQLQRVGAASLKQQAGKPEDPQMSGQHIIFAPIFGFSDKVMATEAVLAKALRLRGNKVSTLRCGHTLPACLWNVFGNRTLDTDGFSVRRTSLGKTAECARCESLHCRAHTQRDSNAISLGDYAEPKHLSLAISHVDRNFGNYKTPIIQGCKYH